MHTNHLLIPFLTLVSGLTGVQADEDPFESRQRQLLAVLTEPAIPIAKQNADVDHYAYRRRWQYYTACLALGIRTEAASRYFAESDEIVADEWPVLLLLRTYFAFKDSALTPQARNRLRDVLQTYKAKFDSPDHQGIERHGTRGNHSIVAFSMYLLLDQELGDGPKHELARRRFIDWVQGQGRLGRDEVNSPHYLDRSLLPLLNLYDFIEDKKLKRWAQLAIDQLVTDFALLSINNVRGGPWCRAHHNHAPGVAEINDGTQDTFYVAGFQFFGNSPLPEYLFTDQILNYAFLATTSYRPSEVAVSIADRVSRGTYEVKSHRRSVLSRPSPGSGDWDMYYYITPAYSLACVQDRLVLDNHVTGRVTRDFKNTQVWELTFADPMKILGPNRRLDVSTGEIKEVEEIENSNTANMQYRNVLFYKGEWLDYNGNLADGGGSYTQSTSGEKEHHFWRVKTSAGDVYVGVIHFPQAGAGILEVGRQEDHASYDSFRKTITKAPARCTDTGLRTTYRSTMGDRIVYDHGRAIVNDQDWPLHNYPLYDSPYVQSSLGSGVIQISKDGKNLTLDFRDRDNPIRQAR